MFHVERFHCYDLCDLESYQSHDCRGSKPEALAKILESNFRSGFQLVGKGLGKFLSKNSCVQRLFNTIMVLFNRMPSTLPCYIFFQVKKLRVAFIWSLWSSCLFLQLFLVGWFFSMWCSKWETCRLVPTTLVHVVWSIKFSCHRWYANMAVHPSRLFPSTLSPNPSRRGIL